MVKGFLARGVPIDGVGLQMHISVDTYPAFADVSANMARLVALGMEVHVTEMDVKCSAPCGTDRLALQATIYGGILQACLDNSAPTAPSGKGGCKSFEVSVLKGNSHVCVHATARSSSLQSPAAHTIAPADVGFH